MSGAGHRDRTQPLRVLTVGNMYPPHHRGGYEIMWEQAVTHLERSGHQVRVLTTTHREPDVDPEADADDPAVRELRWYWHDEAWPKLSGFERLRLERHNKRVLRRHIEEFRPDVMCWWAMGGMSLSLIETARRLGVPETFVLCDDWLVYAPHVDGWMRGMRRLGAARRVVGALTGLPTDLERSGRGPALYMSRWLLDRSRDQGWAFDQELVVGKGVPREMFLPAPPTEWAWRIACVGRLDERKGVDLAIGALAHLPAEAHLSVVGTGDPDYRATLDRLVADLGVGDRVEFSSAARKDLRAVYAAADVVLFPVRWPEPWGLVPLEAMSTGRPVIASGRGGSGEYLHDGVNCLRFDPDAGPAALADAIRALAEDPELRERLRDGGSQMWRTFPEEAFDEAVESIVVDAASSRDLES